MTAPVKPAPTVGDYGGAAQTSGASTSSSSNPNDIWGLGDLYGQPVYLGSETTSGYAPVVYSGDGTLKPGAPSTRKVSNTEDKYGNTQDLMQQIVDLWSAQRQERKKNPNALTGYEQLQQALYSAGFYGQTSHDSIHVGQWTAQTQDAVKAAIDSYETTRTGGKVPITFTEFLLNNAQGGADGGFGGAGSSTKAPFQASLTDPASIRQSAQSAAMQALGQGLSSDQLDAFVAQFQAAQTSAEKAGYDGKDYTSPDLSSQAAAYAQTTAPGAYKQNQRQVFLDSMANLLAGNNVRPSMSPTPTV